MGGLREFYPTKTSAARLDPESYKELCRQVLGRDGWRCQICGSRLNLEVHHRQNRSRSGDDSEQNLVTFCVTCHANVHRKHTVDEN